MKFIKSFTLLCITSLFINACISTQNTKAKRSTMILKSENAMKNFTTQAKFEQLKENLQKQDLHIRIFGDSHMAADFFSRELRKLLIKVNAVGFAYPLQPRYHQTMLLDYESKNFELFNSQRDSSQNYPMGGIIAKALKEDAYISLKSNLKKQNFRVGLVFQSPNSNKAFAIKDAKNKNFSLKSPAPNKWAYQEFKNLHFPLKITASQKDVKLGGYFIYNEEGNKILDTLGINGAKAELWLRWNEKVFSQELDLIKSDIVILAYGSNEVLSGAFNKSKFKSNYKKLIKMLYKSNPNTSIILIAPPTVTQKINDDYQIADEFETVRKAVYTLAKDEKLLLFDMHEFMQNSGGKDLWIEQNLSLKDVHLTIDGYKLMADKFYKDLKQSLRL